MEAIHILLGRPWQFDRKIIYNGLTNEITLIHLGTKLVLHPQTPSHVAKDQLTMKDKRDKEKLEKKRKKKDSKALAPKVKEKEKEGRCSSKKVVKKESHLETKRDIKRALLLKQSFYLLLSRGTSLSIATIPTLKTILMELQVELVGLGSSSSIESFAS